MSNVLKNLAAVADAPLTTHALAFVLRYLSNPQNAERPLVVAHRYTGSTWSTTVYDVTSHRLYRTTTRKSIRSCLHALADECANIRVLREDEVLRLEIVEDARVTATQFTV